LIDSGATDIFVREEELLDPASLVRFHEGEGGTVETAAGEAEIRGKGALFAVVADERGDQAIIRAPALWVPDLESETLLTVSAFVSCRRCNVVFEMGHGQRRGSPAGPCDCAGIRARVNVTGINGEKITLESPQKDGLYALVLRPVPTRDVSRIREMFNNNEQDETPSFVGAGCLSAPVRTGDGTQHRGYSASTLVSQPSHHAEGVVVARLAVTSGAEEPGVGDPSQRFSTCQECPSGSLEEGAVAGRPPGPAAPTGTSTDAGVAPRVRQQTPRGTQLRGADAGILGNPPHCQCEKHGTMPQAKVTTRSRARAEVPTSSPVDGTAEPVVDEEDSVANRAGVDGDTPSPDTSRAQPDPQEGLGARVEAAIIMGLHRKLGHPTAERLREALAGDVRLKKTPTEALLKASREILRDCPACRQSNPTKLPARRRKVALHLNPFEVLHFDVHYLPAELGQKMLLDEYAGDRDMTKGFLLLAVDEASRFKFAEHIEDKKTKTIAEAFLRMEERIRRIMRITLEKNPDGAKEKGYSDAAIRDHSVSVVRRVHSDLGSEFTGHGMTYSHATPLPDEEDGEDAFELAMSRFAPYLVTIGRLREGGAPDTSFGRTAERKQENGLNERAHQTLERKAHAFLLDAGLGLEHFARAYMHAVEVENLLPTSVPIPGTTDVRRSSPYQEVHGFAFEEKGMPLHAFGSLAYPRKLSGPKHMFPRAAGLFLGNAPYPDRDYLVSVRVKDRWRDGWSVIRAGPETSFSDLLSSTHGPRAVLRVLESRSLTADSPGEHSQGQEDSGAGLLLPPATEEDELPDIVDDARAPEAAATVDEGPGLDDFDEGLVGGNQSEGTREEDPVEPHQANSGGSSIAAHELESETVDGPEPAPSGVTESFVTAANDFADDTFVSASSAVDDEVSSMHRALSATRGETPFAYPVLSYKTRDWRTAAFSIRPSDGSIRREIHEVPESEWEEARLLEYQGLLKRKVVDPAILPKGARLLRVKEVYKVRGDNSLKVRVVAQGFLQRPGLDFFETYSAVASISTIRTVVALAASFGLELMTADVEQAYLQADIKEELYIEVPSVLKGRPEFQGFNCLRLRKGLYGTKQAGRGWYEMLKGAILRAGLEEAPEDPCLYVRRDCNGRVDLTVCTVVDDLLGAGVDGAFNEFLDNLKAQGIDLDEKSIGPAREYNGMRITRISKHHYELDQRIYVEELERSYSRTHSWRAKQGVRNPLGPTLGKGLTRFVDAEGLASADPTTLTKEEKADLELHRDPAKRKALNTKYLSLLGSLMWPALITRPDIAFAVAAAAEHSREPWTRHLSALERTLSYLINTKEKKLVYDCTASARQVNLAVFTDSDFASDELDRKSRTGVWVSVNGCPTHWTSRKQTVVADSTTAAEMLAAHKGMQQVRAHAGNLRAMGFQVNYAPLFSDNTATLRRIVNDKPSDNLGAKQLAVHTKQVQEAASVGHKDIWPIHVSTEKNVSDIFTKGHLSGADATDRWTQLEALSRGCMSSPNWTRELITATRPTPDHRGRPVPSMEHAQPITDAKTYFKEASWGRVYEDVFVDDRRCSTRPNTNRKREPACGEDYNVLKAFTAALKLRPNEEGKLVLKKRVKVLELFCGENHSGSRAIRELIANPEKLDIITVDINSKCNPTIVADIRDWNPLSVLRPGEVTFMWCSPPCPDYSPAKTTAPRDLKTADEIAKATIRLILLLKPEAWVIENPTGLLRTREFMIPFLRFLKPTSYCKFKFKYRKDTDVFTNIPCFLPHCRLDKCKYKLENGVHEEGAQRGRSRNGTPGNSTETLHRVPHGLVQTLFLHAFEKGRNDPADYSSESMADHERETFEVHFPSLDFAA